jgi:hypothetical protein
MLSFSLYLSSHDLQEQQQYSASSIACFPFDLDLSVSPLCRPWLEIKWPNSPCVRKSK